MNNNDFYILPNEEGYLVKSYDTNSEVALFRSRRDAEVFISTLTLSPVPSYPNSYSTGASAPQYATNPQQIITPYPTTNGVSPQVFFIQQPASAQQAAPQSCPFYPMMPPHPSMGNGMCQGGMYPGMYPNYYGPQNNNCGGTCPCGHNNSNYHDHFNNNFQPNSDLHTKNNNDLRTEPSISPQANNGSLERRGEEQINQFPTEEYNYGSGMNQNQGNVSFDESMVEQQYNNNSVVSSEEPIRSSYEQGNQEQPPNNQSYYEQVFVTDPVFINQQKQQTEQPQQAANSINVADDDEFFNFVNDNDFNRNVKNSKKETKRLMKEELKAAKMQAKLEKQNLKKAKRRGALDIEDLNPIVE
ncbi:hypothetical protein [Spiroplasma endosymbiont of Polydrusus pterygomalis]|uniref:hypothetical protein n=1 Tax=Spiroplasma endosymbiont of Polydrusus pterygomalis TaxID=3139327 RepID=UPI003CCAE68C